MSEELRYDEATIEELFGEDIPVEKVGFFSGVKRFFRKIFGIKKGGVSPADQDMYSRFKHFYEGIDREDPKFLPVRHAATLCDDALRVANQRIKICDRLNTITTRLSELEAFINLTAEEVTDLKRMLERFVHLAGERSTLLEKLTDYDSVLVEMQPIAEDARQAVPSIKDAEKHQRALRQDIGYLMGEKEELSFEREDMQKSKNFIYRFTLGVVGGFFLILLWLVYMAFFTDVNVFIPTTIFILFVMGFFLLINIFRRRSRKEMRHNVRKQQRAIELLNKKSVLYAYYTNYLRYCYNKYKANNSRTLENNLNDLESYSYLANRIDTVRSLMYETETSIERFVREKKLGGVKSTIEGFAKTINLDDKRKRFESLAEEKEGAEKSLIELDRRHEEIWGTLMNLKAHEESVSVVIDSYMSEAETLFAKQETEKDEPRPIWKLFELFAEGEGSEDLTESASEIVTTIKEGA